MAISCLLSAFLVQLARPGVSGADTIGLGTQTVGANVDGDAAGSAEAFQTAATASGSIASLSVYIDSSSTASSVQIGLYADSGGQPGTLLTSGTISSPVAGAWNTVNVAAASVTTGAHYWISLLAPVGAGTVRFRDVVSGTTSESSSQTNLTSLPGTWSAGRIWNNSPLSAYATLAATGPTLLVTPTSISYSATQGGANPPSSTVSLTNTGSGSLGFTAAPTVAWLSVTPTSGPVPNTLSVQANVTGLAAGTYNGAVAVTPSQGSAQQVSVTLTVSGPPTVAGAPTGVSAQAGNGSAVVSWTAPANGGSPITSYTVMPYVGSVAQTPATVMGNPPATTATISPLTNGTAYTFTVAATNSVGTGPASAPSNQVVPTANTPPGLDVQVSVNSTSSTATTSAFSTAQPKETLVAYVAGDGPSTSGSQTSTVSGAGLTWSLVARANNQPGTAEIWTATASSILSNVTVSAKEGKSGYPQMLTVMSFTSSAGIGASQSANATTGGPTVTLNTTKADSVVYGAGNDWDNPIARTAGTNQTITNQWVATSFGDTFWVQHQNQAVPIAGTTTTINDTTPTSDRWDLVAVEIEGNAVASTAPAAPANVTAQPGNGAATVSWSAPGNGGSPIVSYTVTPYVGTTAQTPVTVTGNPPATSITASQLTNGTTYTFTVTAANSVGTSPPSSPSNSVTPSATPQPFLDPSTPAAQPVQPNVTTITGPAFSPPGGSVIYAVFSMDSASYSNGITQVSSVTNSGTALTWNLLGRNNSFTSTTGGFVEVWWAYNSVAQSSMTVTATFNQPTKNVAAPIGDFQVLVIDNAAANQAAAAFATNANLTTGDNAPMVTVTTTKASSQVFGVFDNWNSAATPVPGTNQSIQSLILNSTDVDGYWVQRENATTAASGTAVQMNATVPGAATPWRGLAWEVLAGP